MKIEFLINFYHTDLTIFLILKMLFCFCSVIFVIYIDVPSSEVCLTIQAQKKKYICILGVLNNSDGSINSKRKGGKDLLNPKVSAMPLGGRSPEFLELSEPDATQIINVNA